MIDELKPYPAYKDSGIPWLGEVPEHWSLMRLRYSVQACINGIWGDDPNGADDLPCIRVADFDRYRLRVRMSSLTMRAIPKKDRRARLLAPGDLLLEKSGGGDQQPVGVVMLYEHNRLAVCSNFVARMPVSQNYNPSYLVYLHAHLYAIRLNVRSIKQTTGIQNLDSSAYLNELVAFPPVEEQTQIATFLDYADHRIRRYIRSKQNLIKLLEEQKQVVINQAVTRGLDPNVPLKPSGIEWLGGIPEHWKIWQIGHFAKVGNGSTPSRGNLDYWQDGRYPWLNSSSVNQGEITKANQFVTNLALKECHLPIVPSGSILVAITGQGKTRGTAALLSIEATINQHIAYITPKKPIVRSNYLKSFLSAAYPELRRMSEASGSTKGALTCWDVSHFKVPIPPIEDQERIEEYLKQSTQNTTAAIERLNSEIVLFREFRTRLIADVVTGKLDVREAAAQLPAEVDDPEPLDDDLPKEDLGLDDDSEPDAAPEDEAA